jgi:PAS domain S-box-containing protein
MSSEAPQQLPASAPDAEQLARQLRVLRALQLATAGAPLDPEANLGATLRLACAELGFDRGAVSMLRGGRHRLFVASTADGAPLASVPLDEKSWQLGSDADRDRQLTLPLLMGEHVVGALTLWRDAPGSPASDVGREIGTYLATHAAGVIYVHGRLSGVVTIFEHINSASDEALFERIVQSVARAFRAGGAVLAECVDQAGTRLRMRALWLNGAPGEASEFGAAGTPAETVLRSGKAFFAAGVGAQFPDDPLLRALAAESYLGAAIVGADGRRFGILAVIDTRPMGVSAFNARLIGDLANRAAAGFERERAQASLRASEERLSLAISTGRIGIWDFDVANQVLHMNEHAKAVIGWEDDAAPPDARMWRDLIHPEDLVEARRIASGAATLVVEEPVLEHRLRHRDGSYRTVLARARIVRDADGRAVRVICAGVDVTEQRRLEAKLQQTQRLESLGVLAGGIAHDFNNLLMGVLGNASLARRVLPDGSPAQTRLRDVETAAQRASELTNELLAYSGSGHVANETLDLREVVGELTALLQTAISKKATLVLDHGSDRAVIDADPGQLRQVIMNLITNASDALGDGSGTITLSTGTVTLDQPFRTDAPAADALPPGRYAALEVRDTGSGMDEETLSRVFDPFFTTKLTGRGLGMAAVLGIVRGHRGAIRIQSLPGDGTVATVLFPLSERPATAPEPPVPAPALVARGAVLVIDDDPMVRTLLDSVLRDAGFEVITAGDGESGLARFAEHADRIQLVLLDLTMPRLGGHEVVEVMRHRAPAARIVLMSGYTAESVEHLTRMPGVRFLKKPFRMEALFGQVRDLMEDAGRWEDGG